MCDLKLMSLGTAPISVNGVLDYGLYDFERGFIDLICRLTFLYDTFPTPDDLWNYCVVGINRMTQQLFRTPPPDRPRIIRPARVDTREGSSAQLTNIGDLSRNEEEEISSMLGQAHASEPPGARDQGNDSQAHSPQSAAPYSPHHIVTPDPIDNPSVTHSTSRLHLTAATAPNQPML